MTDTVPISEYLKLFKIIKSMAYNASINIIELLDKNILGDALYNNMILQILKYDTYQIKYIDTPSDQQLELVVENDPYIIDKPFFEKFLTNKLIIIALQTNADVVHSIPIQYLNNDIINFCKLSNISIISILKQYNNYQRNQRIEELFKNENM